MRHRQIALRTEFALASTFVFFKRNWIL